MHNKLEMLETRKARNVGKVRIVWKTRGRIVIDASPEALENFLSLTYTGRLAEAQMSYRRP